MVLSSTHHRIGHGVSRAPAFSAHQLLEVVERGTYTALLATTGFIIVSLLKVAERRERHAESTGS